MKKIAVLFVFLNLLSCTMVTPQLFFDNDPVSPYTMYSSFIDPFGNFNPGSGWTLAWSDEFNGTSINSDNWTFDIGTGSGGWGNNELEYYTSRAENAFISNGNLVIKAIQEIYNGSQYTSARLKTYGKQSWQYGKIVARMKLPYGKGLWPAFWIMGDSFYTVNWPACGEIDIMELVGGGTTGDRTVTGAAHWDNGGHQYQSSSYTATQAYSQAYHYFELEWSKNFLRVSVDANPYFTLDITPSAHPELSEFQAPFFILLNVAVGGNWPGIPDVNTVFPQTMTVDWVRVYQADLSIPSLSFTSPADNTIISGSFSVTGTATSGAALEGVYLSIDGGSYAKVAGLESWSNTINTGVGAHVVRAFVRDTLGKSSVTNELNVTVTSKPIDIYPTSMPPIGSTDNILGRVDYVNAADYKVCIYIYVPGSGGGENGWWVKPTGASPYTSIAFDGTWSCDYTTGGSDQNATVIRGFLLRSSYSGTVNLYNLSANAVATFRYDRTDTAAPTVAIGSPANGVTVEETSLTVSGTAADGNGVNGVFISVNGSDFTKISGTDSGSSSISWSGNVTLNPGVNTIQVYSRDFGGHVSPTATLNLTQARTVVYVSAAGSDSYEGTRTRPFRSVQKAIDTAVSLGISKIKIASGTYTPGNGLNASGPGILIQNSGLNIEGQFNSDFTGYSGATFLSGENNASLTHIVEISGCDNVTISKMNIRYANSESYNGGGVAFNNTTNCTLYACAVEFNKGYMGGGVYVNGENTSLQLCGIAFNTAVRGGGVFISGNNCTINGGQIVGNTATGKIIYINGVPRGGWSANGGGVMYLPGIIYNINTTYLNNSPNDIAVWTPGNV